MVLLVATLRPASIPDWSVFARLKIVEQGSERAWTQIAGSLSLGASPARTGTWKDSNGTLTFQDNGGKGVAQFFGVHWNFRVLCSQKELTGIGHLGEPAPASSALMRAQRTNWVLGPGLKKKEKKRTLIEPGDLDIRFSKDLPLPSGFTGSTHFRARILFQSSHSPAGPPKPGVEPQVDVVWIQIVDKENKQAAYYAYGGVGGNLGFSAVPTSFSGTGDFQDFETSAPVMLDDFPGSAGLKQDPSIVPDPLGVSKNAKFRLTIGSSRVSIVGGNTLPLSTASQRGLGIGESTSLGRLERLAQGPSDGVDGLP